MTKRGKTLVNVAAAVLFVAVLGLAGRCDWTDEVIYTMPGETYDLIKAQLSEDGHEPSDYEIARFYIDNRPK